SCDCGAKSTGSAQDGRVADGLNRPGSMFDVTVPRINNNTLIPFINQAAPYGTTQGILLFGVGSKGAAVINDIRHSGEQK
ncbi:MAG TPA: hypothetical protein VNZ04_11260, partial [Trinickia sp.]|nr:hypothetical protein [Trinickia sp.]